MSETSTRRSLLRSAGVAGVAPAAAPTALHGLYESARTGTWVEVG